MANYNGDSPESKTRKLYEAEIHKMDQHEEHLLHDLRVVRAKRNRYKTLLKSKMLVGGTDEELLTVDEEADIAS